VKLILVQRSSASRTFEFGRWSWALLSVCFMGLPLGLVMASYELGQRHGAEAAESARISAAEQEASARAEELAQMGADAQRQLEAMTVTLAELQARVTRLDALGTHLTEVAGLDEGEFNFDALPALGGPTPDTDTSAFMGPDAVKGEFDALALALADRETQLDVLSELLSDRQVREEASPAGRPITSGWLSSHYGYRTDPFNGRKTWHQGIDFAGREGSDIVAVASGVVSWSGERSGYGTMVEVSHGDGLVTRYAHNQKNLVEIGDLVRRGETIALMGNTGRSTGPHVHFEVFKHGRPVDPASYIRRTRR
jgi:murein DD-endopeptidase MepM/ murein hydrolase activator NlpD